MANTTVTNVDEAGTNQAHVQFFQGLQESGSKYTDFTIKKGGRSWKVHKVVICTQSEYFRKACDGEFEEAHNNNITLSDDDDEGAISAMIHYLYHFGYKADTSENAPPFVLQDIRLFVVADKYLVLPLREKALRNIRACLGAEWHTDAFPTAIREIYSLAPVHKAMLKPDVIKTVTRFREVFSDEDGRYEAFQTLLHDLPDFAAEAAVAIAKSPLTPSTSVDNRMFECPTCHHRFSVAYGSPPHYRCPFYSTCNTHTGNDRSGLHHPTWWSQFRIAL